LAFTVTKAAPIFSINGSYIYGSKGPQIYAGQPFRVQASVSGGLSSAAATGSITVTFGSLTPQTINLSPAFGGNYYGSGFAFFAPTVPGTYVLSGTYTGDANFLPAVDHHPDTMTVLAPPALAPTTTTLTSSGTSLGPDDIVTLSATVTGNAANTVPTGEVYFFVGGIDCVVHLDATGKATTVLGAEAIEGSDPFFAQYQGDAVYAESSSTPITISANVGDYTLVASNQNVVVASGSTASTTLTIAEIISGGGSGGLTGPVTLTCTPSSPSITCAFSPATLTLLANNVQSSTQLTINTQMPGTATTSLNQTKHNGLLRRGLAGSGIAMAALFLCFPVKRRAMARLLLLALVFAISFGTIACGGSSKPPASTTPPTPTPLNAAPGTYQVVVNTNLSGVQHSLTLNVIVQ
jgi:hypothetical protein